MDKVIFDTNAYRYLVKNKSFDDIDKLIQKLKSREKANNIDTLISPIVAKELLAHVANKKDPSFEKCLKAIKALYLHSGNDKSYNMIASPELLISKSFFNKTIPIKEETNKSIGQMIFHLATNPDKKTFNKLKKNLQSNYIHVSESEKNFAEQLRLFVFSVDPDSKSWQVFPNDKKKRENALKQLRSEATTESIALGFIFMVYQLLIFSGEIKIISNEELRKRAKSLAEMFPEPIALFKQVFENLINSEFNIYENSRANFVWDILLMFNVGNHNVQGSKLYFVTSDKAIIRTAISQKSNLSILSFDEYMEYLKK